MNWPQDFINQIICGDSFEILRSIPDKAIDLVLTDPPYGIAIARNGMVGRQGQGVALTTKYKKVQWDKQTVTEEQIKELIRVSRNQIIFGGNYIAHLLPPSRGWVVWDKRVGETDFSDCELIWTSFNRPARMIHYLWQGMLQGNMRHKEKRYHPTQKPVFVLERLLSMFATKDDIVLDPFLGSGSTVVACQNMGCRFIGIERDPDYVEITKTRMKISGMRQRFWDGFDLVKGCLDQNSQLGK